MKTLYLLCLLVLLFGCKSKENSMTDSIQNDSTENNFQKPQKLVAKIGDLSEGISEGIKISEVVVDGNNIELQMSYSGCQRPVFDLIGSPMIAKSLPPLRSIRLVHNGENGECEELISERLIFDISALTYQEQDGSEIYLQLEGWKEKIKYTYTSK